MFNKISNAGLLALWIFGVIYGVAAVIFSIEMSPICFICASIISCNHYLEKLVKEE